MAQINPPKTLPAYRTETDDREDQLHSVVARTSLFVEDHRAAVIGAIVGILVLAAAVVGWRMWSANQNEAGQQQLGAAISLYETGNFRAALDGADGTPGLLEIVESFGGATGDQARLLAADAHFRLGEFDEALALFEDYDGEGLLEASALAGQAAVYEQKGDAARAATLYRDAASTFTSDASTPRYLLDAARAFAAAGDTEAAAAALQQVVDDHSETPEATTALVEMGRVAAQASAVGRATGAVTAAPRDSTGAAVAPVQQPVVMPAPAE